MNSIKSVSVRLLQRKGQAQKPRLKKWLKFAEKKQAEKSAAQAKSSQKRSKCLGKGH